MLKQIVLGAFVMVIVTSIFGLGWIGNDIYRELKDQRTVDGLYMRNWEYSDAKDEADYRDRIGDWVCVNIRGMDYERALEVCQHETGHEIFAEVCEKDMERCLEVVK